MGGDLVEKSAALSVGKSAGRAAVEMDDVKDLEQRRSGTRPGASQTAAQAREVGAAVIPQAHELTIEDDAPLAERVGDPE